MEKSEIDRRLKEFEAEMQKVYDAWGKHIADRIDDEILREVYKKAKEE